MPLARAVKRRFAPGTEQVKPLFALPSGPELLGMHVDAMGAPVDLRSAQLDKLEQRRLEPAFVNEGMQLGRCLGALRRRLPEIHPSIHVAHLRKVIVISSRGARASGGG